MWGKHFNNMLTIELYLMFFITADVYQPLQVQCIHITEHTVIQYNMM